MKLLKWVVALLFISSAASAGTLSDFWSSVQANSTVSLGNNVAPFVGYDFKDKAILEGGVSNFYSYKSFHVQAGLVKRVTSDDTPSWAVGAGFDLQPLLSKALAATAVSNLVTDPANIALLHRLQIGPFYNYDFKTKVKHYGGYVAIVFGGPSK